MIITRLHVLYTAALTLTAAVCPYQGLNAQEGPTNTCGATAG